MKYLYCVLIGYSLGSVSFATVFSKIKNIDLKNKGTGNLGATNAMLVMGKWCGIAVMLLDVFKAVLAVCIARLLFPQFSASGIVSGASAVAGHIFPFYLKFKGGKGLACFAGMVLALDPAVFVLMFILCVCLMLLTNHSVVVPYTAAVVFPLLYCTQNPYPDVIIAAAAVGILLSLRHIPDIIRVKDGGDSKIREFIKERIRR